MADEGSVGQRKTRILVAEDEYLIAFDITNIVTELNHHVAGPFATARDALDYLEEGTVDAGLLDIQLADGPSYPVADLLRSRGIPYAFLSGYAASDLPPRYQADIIVGKPLMIERVRDVLSHLMQMRKQG